MDFKMSLRDALEFPRIHASTDVEAEPAALVFDVAERLRAMGHKLNPNLRAQGDVQAVLIEESSGWRIGWSDGRRGGSIAGLLESRNGAPCSRVFLAECAATWAGLLFLRLFYLAQAFSGICGGRPRQR